MTRTSVLSGKADGFLFYVLFMVIGAQVDFVFFIPIIRSAGTRKKRLDLLHVLYLLLRFESFASGI